MTFAAVLDTSAVAAYARESEHVGELLQEIGDEDGYAVLPVVCLIEALTGGANNVRVVRSTLLTCPNPPRSWSREHGPARPRLAG